MALFTAMALLCVADGMEFLQEWSHRPNGCESIVNSPGLRPDPLHRNTEGLAYFAYAQILVKMKRPKDSAVFAAIILPLFGSAVSAESIVDGFFCQNV